MQATSAMTNSPATGNGRLTARPIGPAPDVPADELATRLKNIRREMAADQIDALVLSDPKNIHYFTGFVTLAWYYNARPIFALVTAADVFVFGSLVEERVANTKPRNFKGRYYDGYMAEGIALISETIRGGFKGATPRVAIDWGQDVKGLGSLEMVDTLRGLSAGGVLKSAVSALWRVRLIKSPFEAELNRTAFQIANDAWDTTIAQARLGMTEYELWQMMQAQTFLNGADSCDPFPLMFTRGDNAYGRPPSQRRLEIGHYVWADFRATYGGYPADRNRTARAGEPEQWERDTYAAVRDLTHEVCRAVRPGQLCSDVIAHCNKLWPRLNIGDRWGAVSRIGHGGGLDTTEPPSLSPTDKTVIQPGMILHIEPKVELKGALFQFEEAIYVREDRVDFLTPLSPRDIYVIQ